MPERVDVGEDEVAEDKPDAETQRGRTRRFGMDINAGSSNHDTCTKELGKMAKRVSSIILLTAITVACIHKPSGPVSAWERVNVNLAALAQINDDVAKGVIAAQQAGTITVQQTAPILNYQEAVAKDHMALENILAAGSAQAGSQSAQIQALLNEIKNQGTALIQSGGLGIKNPKSQQTFAQDLQGIVNLAEVVLSDFQTAEGK